MDVKETAEDVLTDLQSLDLAELRLMCLNRSLSTAGDEKVLFNRLKSFFGFELDSCKIKRLQVNMNPIKCAHKRPPNNELHGKLCSSASF